MRRLAIRVLTTTVRAYQRVVAPWLPQVCRFTPSCSAYMIAAIEAHGPLRGVALGARRLARCRPGGGSGEDPVPTAPRGRGAAARAGRDHQSSPDLTGDVGSR